MLLFILNVSATLRLLSDLIGFYWDEEEDYMRNHTLNVSSIIRLHTWQMKRMEPDQNELMIKMEIQIDIIGVTTFKEFIFSHHGHLGKDKSLYRMFVVWKNTTYLCYGKTFQ